MRLSDWEFSDIKEVDEELDSTQAPGSTPPPDVDTPNHWAAGHLQPVTHVV